MAQFCQLPFPLLIIVGILVPFVTSDGIPLSIFLVKSPIDIVKDSDYCNVTIDIRSSTPNFYSYIFGDGFLPQLLNDGYVTACILQPEQYTNETMKIIGEHFTFVKVVPLMFYVEPCSSKSWRIGELPPEIRNYAYRIIPLQNSQNIHVGVARLNLKPLPFSFSLVLKKEAPVDTSREGVVKLEQQLGDFGFYASLLPEETINSLRELGFHYVSIMTSVSVHYHHITEGHNPAVKTIPLLFKFPDYPMTSYWVFNQYPLVVQKLLLQSLNWPEVTDVKPTLTLSKRV